MLQTKLEKQDEIDTLAKLKRSGRLTQKDYNERITALHSKKEPPQKVAPVVAAKSVETPTLKAPSKAKIPNIEEIIIDDDDGIFNED